MELMFLALTVEKGPSVRGGPPRVLCFATQGSGSGDEQRIRALLEPLAPAVLPFDRTAKGRSALGTAARLIRERPDVVVMEGTGIAGGLAVLAARLAGVRYVVSSGDAVAPYLSSFRPWLRPVAAAYERALCRAAAGFVGWSPYLVGRALTLGAPRAMTAAGWAPHAAGDRAAARERFGIPPEALVFGLVGSLGWHDRAGYCYGAELVRAATRLDRGDIRVLVVGDGSGRQRLEELAGDRLGRSVLLPGAVPREDVPLALAAMDVGSLPQSVDGVGAFRYTTKISEYLAAGLPVVTGEIPLAYDLDDGWLWRLPGDAPWDERYVAALAELMRTLTHGDVAERRSRVPREDSLFSLERQQRQVCDFVADVARR
jgi:Glycosyl transferases group 1/Glycosyl transferase 4-like domain